MTDIKAQLAAIHALQPSARFEALFRAVREFSPEEFRAALPSTQMGPEGPVLVRVLPISDSYFIDLHLGSPDLEFDFALRKVHNYRVSLGEVTVKLKEEERRYQTAQIQLLYLAGVSMQVVLTYVGLDRATWLAQVREAIPIKAVLPA